MARPIPSTQAPKITAHNERIAIGNPEKGASITKTPSNMRVLERDMRIVYRRSALGASNF